MPGSEFSAVSGWPTKETADKLGQISGRIVKRFSIMEKFSISGSAQERV